ncbi:MAG: RNA polymerase sigma factor [Gemmataceae bacterium]|nr:RNA polymerase sigma factor [Gemmataceae bacterium]
MTGKPLSQWLRQFCRRAGPDEARGLSDAELLRRFVDRRDEAAFEVLLWRHGPLVLGVCRRLLPQDSDVEDAFQATFLVLVRKAGAISKRASVAAWLYRVAYRIALAARAASAKRDRLERRAEVPPTSPAEPSPGLGELRAVLDEEVNRLPAKYRLPVILCYLQGKTHGQAAAELGCPKGTVAVRLMRAREQLRAQLTRRGLELPGGVLAPALVEPAGAAVPAGLHATAVDAALRFSTHATAAGAIPPRAAALAQGVLGTMLLNKLKTTTLLLLLVGLLAVGLGLAVPHLFPTRAEAAQPRAAAPAVQPPAKQKPRPKPEEKKEPLTARAVAWKFVAALVIDHDPQAAVPLVDPDAERAQNGRGSLAAALNRLKPESLRKDGQLKQVIFFAREDIPALSMTYPDRMWRRFTDRIGDGLGCLMVIDTGRPNSFGLMGFLIRPVKDESRVVYSDDN